MKTTVIILVFLFQLSLCFSQINDLVLKQPYLRFDGIGYYSMIPKDLRTDLKLFYADVLNNGIDTQTNVSLNIKIFNSFNTLFNQTGLTVSSISPDSSQIIYLDSLGLLKYSLPNVNDNYIISYSVNQSEIDEFPNNNKNSLSVLVNDSVYARDIEKNTSISFNQIGAIDGDFIGTSYYFPVDNEVNSLSVFVDSNTTTGTTLIGKALIDNGGGNIIELISTDIYNIEANDIGQWITIPFIKDGSSEFIVSNQMIYIGVECYGLAAGDIFIGADSSTIHDFQNESIIRINNVYQSIDKVPLIRLNTVYSICACPCYFSSRKNVSCNGGNDGSATVSGSGGVPPYTFLWSNGEATQTATNLSAGIYTVTVTDAVFDANGCTVTITEPTYLTVVADVIGNSIELIVNGGTPPYSYLWNTGDTTSSLTNVAWGCYTVTVTDANNCTYTEVNECAVQQLNYIDVRIFLNIINYSLYVENFIDFNIEIYNITGAKLLETKCTEQSTTIDISSFVNGTYIVKAFKDNSLVYKKICIVR